MLNFLKRRQIPGPLLLIAATTLLVFSGSENAASERQLDRQEILKIAGTRGGLIVHLGCGDGAFTAALRAHEGCVVQGLDSDAEKVRQAQRQILARGLFGSVWFDCYDGQRLPYVDNLANLVVVSQRASVPRDEVLRILAPGGVACIEQGGAWTKTVKPRPPQIDEWTHYLHDASGNAVAHDTTVGPPRHLQWTAGPTWCRQHDHVAGVNALVSAGGRIFYIIDEAPTASIVLPPQWSLVARDAFNGLVLWKRPIPQWIDHLWPLKSGPAQLPRRLVALGDRVFVTLGLDAPLSMLDAATGQTLRTYPESAGTEEVILGDGRLFLVVRQGPNPWGLYRVESLAAGTEKTRVGVQWKWDEKPRSLLAIDLESGALAWKKSYAVAPLTLAADNRGVYFYDGGKVVALDRAQGELVWASAPLARRPVIVVNYGLKLIVADGVVLFAGGDHSMTALAAESGKTLWTAPHPASGCNSPEDLFVVHGSVWAGATASSDSSGVFTQRALHTGQVQKEFPPDDPIYHFPHHRCYPSKATDNYILTSRTGIEFVDTRSGHWTYNHWVRGGCLYGLMPCNGLIYTPPHYCACFVVSKLNGFCALAPESPTRPTPNVAADGRLERGPAYPPTPNPQSAIRNPQSLIPSAVDWPTYRHDPARSGATPASVPAALEVAWQTRLHGRITAPTIAGQAVFVAETEAHTVCALDAHDGRLRWRFTAGGPVDSPPTIYRGCALFGSADGWVYCLRASDGQLAWRFRAAPEQRMIVAEGQLESAWPVHGSVLVENDTLYCVAGRSMFLDGGLRLLRLDPVTGRKQGEIVRDERNPATGKNLQYAVNEAQNMRMPVALPDILSATGVGIVMRSSPLDFGPSPPVAGPAQAKPPRAVPVISCLSGFLDDSWMNRLSWRCRQSLPSRILVVDQTAIYGLAFSPQYGKLSPHEHRLYAARLAGAARRGPDGQWILPPPLWSQAKLPLLVRAMALAGQTLFVAGPPDLGMAADEDSYRNFHDPGHQAALGAQTEAWNGKRGGLLWAVSKTDGKRLMELKLDSPPVWDGLAAAAGRLCLSTADGRVLCFSGR